MLYCGFIVDDQLTDAVAPPPLCALRVGPLPQEVVRPEGFMRHDWIFDVLSDLKTYAIKNDLPALAAKVEEALALAKVEVEAQGEEMAGSAKHRGTPSGRAH